MLPVSPALEPRAVVRRTAATCTAVLVALAAGWVTWLLSCWLVPPADGPNGFGLHWQQMAADPFALHGPLPHRLLAPLLAWLFGFGAEGWMAFTQLLHVVLLAAVFGFVRGRGLGVVDALLVAATIALTAPTQIYKEQWIGHADPLGFALFVALWASARVPLLFWALFLATLLHHEMAALFLPWLWFVRRRVDDRRGLDLLLGGAALTIYAAYYLSVRAAVQPTYSVDYFLAYPLFPGGTVVVWLLTFVHWLTGFGPMLALLGWHQRHLRAHGERGERWHTWLVSACVFGVFCIAFDWSRHANLLFLPLVLAAQRFLAVAPVHRWWYAGLLALTVALSSVPLWRPWQPMSWPMNRMANLELLLGSGVVRPGPDDAVGFGPLSATLGNWLPEVWGTVVACVSLFAVMVLAGAALLPRR